MLSFFFTATSTTEIYTLSLHDALPIYARSSSSVESKSTSQYCKPCERASKPSFKPRGQAVYSSISSKNPRCMKIWPDLNRDRKSTRLNSSHVEISYAVFCLKKKNKTTQ